jgi:hypothetical protein
MCQISDRADRFADLAARLDRSALDLRRRLCEARAGTLNRVRLLRRTALIEDRRDRLRTLSRVLRHEARRMRLV